MNDIVFLNEQKEPVTTSLLIAEGAGVEHRAVLQLIRNYINDFNELGRVAFKMLPFETAGGTQKREIAELNEQQTTFIFTLMRNSEIVVQFKKRLVKAFYEMRNNPTLNPANLSRMQLIQLAMEAEQERQALEEKVNEMKPDCDAFARIAVSEGSMSLTDAAKALQVQPKAFIACLSAERWIYKRLGTSWIAYQDKIQQGLLEHKVTVVQRDDGTEKSVHQVRVTPKGIARLSKLMNARKAA